MKSVAIAWAFVGVLAACASSPPPSPPSSPAPPPKATPAPSGHTARMVRIDPQSFDAVVNTKTDLATAKKWCAVPANATNVRPEFRHILVKAPRGNAEARAAAKRKADELLTRLDRGESFATLAKSSDDPGSANKGGAYPGRTVKMFVKEIRRAYDELRPNERARAPIETDFGWHVVEKGPVDDEACLEGHRTSLARAVAERIGADLAQRLRHVEGGVSAREVERAYAAALDAECGKVELLPSVVRMPADTCDGFASIARGTGTSWRDDVLLAVALTDDAADGSEVDSSTCGEEQGGMTADEVRALVERTLKERAKRDAR